MKHLWPGDINERGHTRLSGILQSSWRYMWNSQGKGGFCTCDRVVYAICDVSYLTIVPFCIVFEKNFKGLPLEQLLHQDCCQCMLWTLEQNHLDQHSPWSDTSFHLANRQIAMYPGHIYYFFYLREEILSQVKTKRESISFRQMNTCSATSNLKQFVFNIKSNILYPAEVTD